MTKMREEVLKGLGFEVFALEDGRGLGVLFEFELHVNSFDINFDFSIIQNSISYKPFNQFISSISLLIFNYAYFPK